MNELEMLDRVRALFQSVLAEKLVGIYVCLWLLQPRQKRY